MTLLSSGKFKDKAEDVLKEGLEHLQRKPVLNVVEKRLTGNGQDEVQLVPLPMTKSGIMLYTSGTTSRPVYTILPHSVITANISTERRLTSGESPQSPSRITSQSLAIHPTGSPPSCPAPSSYPWHRQRPPHSSFCRLDHRILVPIQCRRGLGAPSRTVHTGQEQGTHYFPDCRPDNIQSLPLVIRQALRTSATRCQTSFIA